MGIMMAKRRAAAKKQKEKKEAAKGKEKGEKHPSKVDNGANKQRKT